MICKRNFIVVALLCAVASGRSSANTAYTRLPTEIVPTHIYSDAGNYDSDRVIAHIIDASGLSYDGSGNLVHANTNPTIWMSPQNKKPTWIAVDFGAVYSLEKFKVWNYNQSGASGRGLAKCNVYVSSSEAPYASAPDFTDSAVWTCVTNEYVLEKASAANTYQGMPTVELESAVPARWFALEVLDYYANDYAGLSELQFFRLDEVAIMLGDILETTLSSIRLTGLVLGGVEVSEKDVYFVWGNSEGGGYARFMGA